MTTRINNTTEKMQAHQFKLSGNNKAIFSRHRENEVAMFLLTREVYLQERATLRKEEASLLSDEARIDMTAPTGWKVTEGDYPNEEQTERTRSMLQLMYLGDGIYLLRRRESCIYLKLYREEYDDRKICAIKLAMPRNIRLYRKAFLRRLGFGEGFFGELERGSIVTNDLLSDLEGRTRK